LGLDEDSSVGVVGERDAELLVELDAVVFVGLGEQAHDVAERVDEGADLGAW